MKLIILLIMILSIDISMAYEFRGYYVNGSFINISNLTEEEWAEFTQPYFIQFGYETFEIYNFTVHNSSVFSLVNNSIPKHLCDNSELNKAWIDVVNNLIKEDWK